MSEHIKKPCENCPFRKDTQKGWLGAKRMKTILQSNSFICHKTAHKKKKQCAGFMLLKGKKSMFVGLAKVMNVDLHLQGRELVFDNEQDCINHHTLTH